VQPIAYDAAENYQALWDTLAAWAMRAQNPEAWYESVIPMARKGPQSLLPHERGQVAGQLQAIKVRGKPIEEVIEFSFVEPSDEPERYKNINTLEAKFIVERLQAIIDEEEGVTVGIITRFGDRDDWIDES
jgi:hypothetical protein